MVKLKSIKKKLTHIKCCVQKVLTPKQLKSNPQPDFLEKIKTNLSAPSSAEGFIPLAAKDSQWVGLQFYNPHFRHPPDEDDDVEEDEQRPSSDDSNPIFVLFPGLKKTENIIKGHEATSTTEITKLLVGQKADFRVMKGSNKVTPADNKLSPVRELPQEEKNASETDVSIQLTQKISTTETGGRYEDEEDNEPVRSTHTKRRKKKSDVKVVDVGPSDESMFAAILPKRPPSKSLRLNSSSSTKKMVFGSPHPSFADGEEGDSIN